MRDIKFQFLYKGAPYSSTNSGFNWHKKVYSLDQFISNSLCELSDIHGACELVAKRQFTGLKDKNGVELYAGDVVYLAGYGNYVCEFPFIELYEGAAENDIGALIGNIYQNPELIENNNK